MWFALDDFGHHQLACTRSGWLKCRATGIELSWLQVCLEAGASARHRPLLRNLAIRNIPDDDLRQLDIVAGGLPIYGGHTVLIDITLRSPVAGDGSIRFRSDVVDGATFAQARRDKLSAYPELAEEDPRRIFLVLACEIGGRMSVECHELLRQLLREKIHNIPSAL